MKQNIFKQKKQIILLNLEAKSYKILKHKFYSPSKPEMDAARIKSISTGPYKS